MVIGGGSGGLACSKEGNLVECAFLLWVYKLCVAMFTSPSVLTAALLGQNVAVLDYVEPSMKGNAKRESSRVSLSK